MTYGAGLITATSPAYLSPLTAPAGVAGTAAGGLAIDVGNNFSIAGTGLQIGSAMWIGGQTGNWRPLAAAGIPAIASAASELHPLIGPGLEDWLQNYIASHGPGADTCVKTK